jgi:penicillin-binding protein activator
MSYTKALGAALFGAAGIAMILACGGSGESTYVRGDEVAGIDQPAMSTGLDRADLDELFGQNIDSLLSSRFYRNVASGGEAKSLAIFPFKNETSEHIGPQLQTLLSKVETQLVNDGVVDVYAHERQGEILAELKLQQSDFFDKSRIPELGRLMGVNYIVTGKVYDSAERTSDVRRVQYFLFMQVIDVETGAVKWQQESELTKALVPLE